MCGHVREKLVDIMEALALSGLSTVLRYIFDVQDFVILEPHFECIELIESMYVC